MDRRTRNTGRDTYGKRVTEQSFKQGYPPGQADRAGGGRYAQRSSTAGNRTGSRYGQVPTGDRVRGRYGQIQIGDRTGRGYAQAESYERVSYARSMDRRYGGKKRRRTGRKISPKIFLIVFLVLLLVCGAGTIILYRSQKTSLPKGITVNLDSLDSPNAVLIDADTGTVIGSKNAQTRIYPASMVKIMTVLTAIREIRNLGETVEMSYDYYDMLYARDASRAGFEPGEKAVIRDLLYGALLPSGAECCMELALQAAGSESAFVELMNQNASKLGLTQTQFTNCTGLHDEGQYSTPAEIAAILQDALKNKTFYKVFTTKSYTVEATEVHPDGFTFQSSMFKGMQSPTVIGGEILGGKTGYTDDAGHCLASMAKIGGREYILVTAGWAQNPRVDQYHINDAFLAYNELGRALEAE
ncbi:MAG: D-alanyl-D-alanine carboxypeptidase [Lachnospiraceae bacterium]|nr:D-alanyl-D-alanine carboxypeptidase [Lachnospiraceae bacterium]